MIIALTGRIAAGKETLTGFLRDKGFIYLESSKLLKDELIKRGLEITRINMQDLGDELRGKYGSGAIMKLLLEIADKDKTKDYIFDSLRNAGEADFLRENVKDFFLIGVDAPQRLRFERIISRGKTSDPKTWEEFLEVDNRDFFDEKNPNGQQVRKVTEKADFIIMNDRSLEDSMKRIEEIWKEIENRTNKIERVCIFIDGSNLYHSLKNLNSVDKMDFQKLVDELAGDRELVKVFYYNASLNISINAEIYWKQQKFFDILRKIPKFEVILCKQRKVNRNGEWFYEVKGDDTHLVSDFVGEAYENFYDIAIIVSGDEDFISPIKRVRKLGKKIENAWFSSSSSFNLRNACDRSIHLNKILFKVIN